MILYRVEDNDEIGAFSLFEEDKDGYRTTIISNYFENSDQEWQDMHPTPDSDPFLKQIDLFDSDDPYHWHFCFETMKDLNKWFSIPELRQKLKNAGAAISIIEADVFVLGQTQAIYCRNHEYKILKRIPL